MNKFFCCAISLVLVIAVALPLLSQAQNSQDQSFTTSGGPNSTETYTQSLTEAIWGEFYRLSTADTDTRLATAQRVTGLPVEYARRFVAFALGAWAGRDEIIREQVMWACENRETLMSFPELMDWALRRDYERERFEQLAVAGLIEHLGEEAANKMIDTINPTRSERIRNDYVFEMRQKDSVQMFTDFCNIGSPDYLY